MFIHRHNVDQYAYAKPRPAAPPPASLVSASPSTFQVGNRARSSSVTKRTSSRSTPSPHVLAPTRRSQRRPDYHDYESDSEEIVVEEVFNSFPPRGSIAAQSIGRTSRVLSSAASLQPPSQLTAKPIFSFTEPRDEAVAAQIKERGYSNGFGKAPEWRFPVQVDTTSAAVAATPALATVGLGGLSPLARVSPGESHLSDGFVLRGGQTGSDEAADDASSEREADGTEREYGVDGVVEVQTRQHREKHEVESAVNNTQTRGCPLSVGVTTASRAASTSPSADNTRLLPHLRSVSDLERTLAAATKALTAAAAREAERRAADEEAEKTRTHLVTAPCVEVQRVHDAFLSTALKEKVLLFDAYLAGSQGVADVMAQCGALLCRDAERKEREADTTSQLLQEKAALHKMAMYRQHVTTEAARVAAEAKSEAERRAADDRLAEMTNHVAQLQNRVVALEADAVNQQKVHRAEELQRRQVTQASALELRALQRAHGQATERWMALQVAYAALRDSYAVLHKKRTKIVCPRDVLFRDGVDCFEIAKGSTRIWRKEDTAHSSSLIEPVCLFEQDTRAKEEPGSLCEEKTSSASRDDLAADGHYAVATEAPTALEALLARTTSDSGVLPASPLLSQPPPAAPRTTQQGCFSSPPDTPLRTPAASGCVETQNGTNGASSAGHSPDAQPTSPVLLLHDKDDDDEAPARRDSGSTRRTSSMRPSRLNSVASTRRGSSPALPLMPDALATVNGEGVTADDSPLSGSGAVHVKAHGTDDSVDQPRGIEWEESRLRATAALVVERELARLLKLTVEQREVSTVTSTSGILTSAKPLLPALPSTLLSTPSLLHEAVTSDGEALQKESESLLLPALQWMRVCETAHHSAQVCSRLNVKMQRVVDSLQQRLQLLDEKDWNKTMARRFIAVEHVAALQRLTGDIRSVLGSAASPSSKRATVAQKAWE